MMSKQWMWLSAGLLAASAVTGCATTGSSEPQTALIQGSQSGRFSHDLSGA